MSNTASKALSIASVDELVRDVANLLPFPTMLDADMADGGWVLQAYFGSAIDESTGRPVNRICLDPDDAAAVWGIDFEVGARQKFSTLGTGATPAEVAAWVIANAEMPSTGAGR